MKDLFASYEQAIQLKELGFDEPCLAFYNGEFLDSTEYNFDSCVSKDIGDCVSTPLKIQILKWFREKHNILASIYSNASGYLFEWHDSIGGTHRGWSEYEGSNDAGCWDSYEEAEMACIDKLIDIIKSK